MNNNHSNRFFDGFLLGVIVGALGVFLFGTKSGKNLLKILSDQGLDGFKNIIDEYNLETDEQDFEDESPEVVGEVKKDSAKHEPKPEEKVQDLVPEVQEEIKPPKKRFFKRLRK